MATGVIINWAGRTYKTRQVIIGCGKFRVGDFMLFRGEMTRIEAVQTECYSLEKLHRFVMVTLETRGGDLIPVRSPGKKLVNRITS